MITQRKRKSKRSATATTDDPAIAAALIEYENRQLQQEAIEESGWDKHPELLVIHGGRTYQHEKDIRDALDLLNILFKSFCNAGILIDGIQKKPHVANHPDVQAGIAALKTLL